MWVHGVNVHLHVKQLIIEHLQKLRHKVVLEMLRLQQQTVNPAKESASENINCEGNWSPCYEDCSDSIYTVTVPQSGQGVACEANDGASRVCNPGDGECCADGSVVVMVHAK